MLLRCRVGTARRVRCSRRGQLARAICATTSPTRTGEVRCQSLDPPLEVIEAPPPLSLPLPLEVGPLNPAMGVWGAM